MKEWIDKITYGTLSNGSKNGFVAYEIMFNGGEAPIGDSADPIATIMSHYGTKCKRIHLSGSPHPRSFEMLTLVKSLSDLGFQILATVDGAIMPQWITGVAFVSVELLSPRWAPFEFSELIYSIDSLDSPEPMLPQKYNPVTEPLFVRPRSDIPGSDTFSWISKAKNRWNINVKGKEIKEVLYDSRKDGAI